MSVEVLVFEPYGITDERFWSKVDRSRPDGCWLWTAAIASTGYGVIMAEGQVVRYAHRVAWMKANGQEIPPGHQVHHKCHVRACCNPAHLELLTESEHGAAHVRERTACKRGHSMADAYLRPDTQARQCRTCLSQRASVGWQKRKAQRGPIPERPCAICATPFRPKLRSTATMCSPRCRSEAFKRRHGLKRAA